MCLKRFSGFYKHLKIWIEKSWKYRYTIFRIICLFCLTVYVLVNWKTCVSMRLFSCFDGNNILFVVWIVLMFLMMYDIEGNGIKFTSRRDRENGEKLDAFEKITTMLAVLQNDEEKREKFEMDACLKKLENKYRDETNLKKQDNLDDTNRGDTSET